MDYIIMFAPVQSKTKHDEVEVIRNMPINLLLTKD